MLPIETELCAYTVESCRAAARAGMTRVELCASPGEGGTTPSAAAVRMARSIPGLELAVMIRPRGGDFLYTAQEFDQMRLDIEYARSCGADAVVLGLLLPDGRIDTERTAELVAAAGAMEVTFHRAADLTPDPVEAVGDILAAGCRRILTSGGRVLFVVGKGATLAEARANALRDVARIGCDNLFHRTDIGHWAFEN